MKPYNPQEIEPKWQQTWAKEKLFEASSDTKKEKFYTLVEFPYPSGDGLHVGHIRSYTALDIIARKRRAEGFNVLYPMGWDAFGLPTENYSIKTGIKPALVTKQNSDTFRRQLQATGFSFDWSREVNTTDPNYYKWTQWIFLQLYKHGLAYKAKQAINWCPKDKIGLANEEVIDGKCERCGTAVEQRDKEQWLLAITKYAERLDKDLDTVDFLPQIKAQQRHWIGNLRDWVFSRQRYWGEPIPMIHCEKCGWQPVAEDQLPVTLPDVARYEPTDTGESPLAGIADWVNTTCPKCGGAAKRETDTMPNWAGSSWYWLAYATKNKTDQGYDLKNRAALDYWTPVDWYNGGMEHTTLHLLYSRFWHKFLFDIGLVPTSEPYTKRTSHGIILAGDGEKMSKSRGNVINPDEIIRLYGADTLRVYEMFMGPFEQAVSWNTDSIIGSRRFLERVWLLSEKVGEVEDSQELKVLLNQTVQKVSSDIETMKFNTAISTLMVLVNKLSEAGKISSQTFATLLQLLAPFAPHIAEELWREVLHTTNSIHSVAWPQYDASLIQQRATDLIIQVNGVVRDRVALTSETDWTEESLKKIVLERPQVQKLIAGKELQKFIVVPQKLVNIVV